ncbi:MAG: riboflavin synthase [Candidatus Aminicenantes bacterium]|nr:riboflavin synthase [Candidatus Aminicenantes bacterium]
MFTGIIHHQGLFKGYASGRRELAVEVPEAFPSQREGESIAVEGVCLSLLRREANTLFFNLAQETLARTNLGSLKRGLKLNLEPPLTLQSPLSGHLINGHIDGVGKVLRIVEKAPGRRLTISLPRNLRPFLVAQGSVAVSGVSLTVAGLGTSSFDVELIPLTIAKSNLKDLRPGQTVNLECDMIGKYVYNWLSRGKSRV